MFYTAISGLNAFKQQLAVISDNIANSQTASYKSGDVSFAEVIASAGTVGSGVNVQNISLGWTQGAISNTGNANDFAITGAGFFIVNDTTGVAGYTRDGQFSFNAAGSMVNAEGMTVQGYPIDLLGNVSNIYSDITISNAPIPATPTTIMTTTVNLDSGAAIGATSRFSATVNTYDSLGNAVPVTIAFQKTAANIWSYTPSIPAADGAVTSAAGALTFSATGALLLPAADQAITFTLLSGATTPQTVTWDIATLGVTNGTMTQFAGPSALYGMSQNGIAQGQLTGIASSNSGIITASYSNGETRSLYQIALADFQNYDGLSKTGNNLYRDTPAITGGPIPGVAGSGRFGSIAAGSLEASNVDMAKEMANMILAQRAYESCARVFSTESEMLKTVVNMS